MNRRRMEERGRVEIEHCSSAGILKKSGTGFERDEEKRTVGGVSASI